MTRRYYTPDLQANGGSIELTESELQHAVRVMRVQLGDQITLFDGRGHEAEAVIIELGRRQCLCDAEPMKSVDRESAGRLELAIALPKPDRAYELIQRLTELGVDSVTPLISERLQRPPSKSLLAKLERGVIEACKQSGRNQLMRIDEPVQTLDFFADQPTLRKKWIVHPGGGTPSIAVDRSEPIVAAIGPEGGWADEEVAFALANGFIQIGLGKRILRIETASVVVASRVLD